MGLKNKTKQAGSAFAVLKQLDEVYIRQSILIADNGLSRLMDLSSAIQRIQEYFPQAKISVLTSEDRMPELERCFKGLKFILTSKKFWPKRYRTALRLLTLGGSKFDLVILLSLDITPLLVSLAVNNSRVILYNQWGQWYSLKLRNISDIFESSYSKQKGKFGIKNILKRIGLFFVLVKHDNEEAFKQPILVIDNSFATYSHVKCTVNRIKESLPYANVSILGFEKRKGLEIVYPGIGFIKPYNFIIKKLSIARHLLRLKGENYEYIVLLSLDISPILVSLLFMNSKLLLHNQWGQWWGIGLKSARVYLLAVPKFILDTLFNIVILAYLLINISWALLVKSFNVFKANLFSRGD
jgi:hypothetical protein